MNQCPFCGKELPENAVGCRECAVKWKAVLAQLDDLSDGGRTIPVLDFSNETVVGFIDK